MRLSNDTLAKLETGRHGGALKLPRYQRSRVTPGIVHLGVGNFHRAHQAVYIDDVLNRGESDWGIIGVSLKRPDMRDALAPQHGLYCLLEQEQTDEGPETRARVVGSLLDVLVAPESPAAVIAAIADPRIKLVTLTITEKGYCLDSDQQQPDWQHPDIEHDLRWPDQPRTAMGLLLAALRQRAKTDAPPLTVLSCDNLASNGQTLRRLLTELAHAQAQVQSQTQSQTQSQVKLQAQLNSMACPSSIVDRIVPHTSAELRNRLASQFGVEDAWPVSTEAFSQWVLEDHFAGPRPRLEEVGVQFVNEAAPYEAMKLRLLNAAHSAIAYLGVPAGWETVDQAMAQPALLLFIQHLWADEIIPFLPVDVRSQAPAYASSLIARFGNAALAHRTEQIAMDGSLKIPLRWLPSLRRLLIEGRNVKRFSLCIAAWINFLGGKTESGEIYPISDPMAARLQELARTGTARDRVHAVLSQESVFGELAHESRLVDPCVQALETLRSYGTLAALQASTPKIPGR